MVFSFEEAKLLSAGSWDRTKRGLPDHEIEHLYQRALRHVLCKKCEKVFYFKDFNLIARID